MPVCGAIRFGLNEVQKRIRGVLALLKTIAPVTHAAVQAKCFAVHLLQNLSLGLPLNYTSSWQMWPIPKPKDGLRVNIAPLN